MKKLFQNIKVIFSILFNKHFLKKPDFSEKRIILQGQINEKKNLEKDNILNLAEIEFSAFSQFGEDGIISWLSHQIPDIEKVFLEIGTQDYWESNTRFLIQSQNWKGYLIEASTPEVKKIRRQSIYWKKNLTAINEFVDRENINSIIQKNLKSNNIGLLSLDIDGNDYWIMKEANIESDLIVCEYNPVFGDLYEITIPYEKNFNRTKKHYSNLFFGCSIKALVELMKEKNYDFLGSNSQGMNAFFINKKKNKYFEKKIKERKIFFPIIREGRDKSGNLNHNNLIQNLKLIQDEEVYDLKNKKLRKISDFGNLYSSEWLDKF